MKFFRRWLLITVTGLSLILLVASAAAWGISFRPSPPWQYGDQHISASIFLWHGQARIVVMGSRHWEPNETPRQGTGGDYEWPRIGLALVSNSAMHDPLHYKGFYYYLRFPCWLPTLLALILPIAYLLFRKRKTPPANQCRICGYDLRATPERCPECGTVSAKP